MSVCDLDKDSYVKLLGRMIHHTRHLQNKPPKFVPKEDLIGDIVEDYLKDIKGITIERISYVKGRNNIIVTYGQGTKTMAFIGSHMDVVPVVEDEWDKNPFELTVEGDRLWGRGTTDCLGHVALLTEMIKNIAENKVSIPYKLVLVFIADEEDGRDPTIGIPRLCDEGKLDFLKNGPIYWVDSSDIHPTIGSGTGMTWKLNIVGKGGHSGLPFNAINPILLGTEVIRLMLDKFGKLYPEHPKDSEYGYKCISNMKPTRITLPEGSVNQIPSKMTIEGDVRLTPFYDPGEVKKQMSEYIESLDVTKIHTHHPSFSYVSGETTAKLKLEWIGEPYLGVACDLKSLGFKLLSESTRKYTGITKTFAETGSLPLIGKLCRQGFDVQIMGYGKSEVYHARNEYCSFNDMRTGYNIMMDMIIKHLRIC